MRVYMCVCADGWMDAHGCEVALPLALSQPFTGVQNACAHQRFRKGIVAALPCYSGAPLCPEGMVLLAVQARGQAGCDCQMWYFTSEVPVAAQDLCVGGAGGIGSSWWHVGWQGLTCRFWGTGHFPPVLLIFSY